MPWGPDARRIATAPTHDTCPWAGKNQTWTFQVPQALYGRVPFWLASMWWVNGGGEIEREGEREKGREERGRTVHVLGRGADLGSRGADLESRGQWGTDWCGYPFLPPVDHLPWAAARGHVWVSSPDSDVVVCVDVHGFCYYQWPCRCPWGWTLITCDHGGVTFVYSWIYICEQMDFLNFINWDQTIVFFSKKDYKLSIILINVPLGYHSEKCIVFFLMYSYNVLKSTLMSRICFLHFFVYK